MAPVVRALHFLTCFFADHSQWRSTICAWILHHAEFLDLEHITNCFTLGHLRIESQNPDVGGRIRADDFVNHSQYGLKHDCVWDGAIGSLWFIVAAFLAQIQIPTCTYDGGTQQASVRVWVLDRSDGNKLKICCPIDPGPWEQNRLKENANGSTHVAPLFTPGAPPVIPVWDVCHVNYPHGLHYQAAVQTSVHMPATIPAVSPGAVSPGKEFHENFTTNIQCKSTRTGPIRLPLASDVELHVVDDDRDLSAVAKWIQTGFNLEEVHTQTALVLDLIWGRDEKLACVGQLNKNWEANQVSGPLCQFTPGTLSWCMTTKATVWEMLKNTAGDRRIEFGVTDNNRFVVHVDDLLDSASFPPMSHFEASVNDATLSTHQLAGPTLVRDVIAQIKLAFQNAPIETPKRQVERLAFITSHSVNPQQVMLHYDDFQIIVVCLQGRKRWLILAPQDAPHTIDANPHVNEFTNITPRSHPHLRWQVVDMMPGQILLLPARWLHYVLSDPAGTCTAQFWLQSVLPGRGLDTTQDLLCQDPADQQSDDAEQEAQKENLHSGDILTQRAMVNGPAFTPEHPGWLPCKAAAVLLPESAWLPGSDLTCDTQ